MKKYLGLLGAVALTLSACSQPKGMTLGDAVTRVETNRLLWSCHEQNMLTRPEFDAAQNIYPVSLWHADEATKAAAKQAAKPQRASAAQCRNVQAGARQNMTQVAAMHAQQSANIQARAAASKPTTCVQPMPGTVTTCF